MTLSMEVEKEIIIQVLKCLEWNHNENTTHSK